MAKTKTLISFAVTAKLICVFVFAYANIRFSHNEAQLYHALTIYISSLGTAFMRLPDLINVFYMRVRSSHCHFLSHCTQLHYWILHQSPASQTWSEKPSRFGKLVVQWIDLAVSHLNLQLHVSARYMYQIYPYLDRMIVLYPEPHNCIVLRKGDNDGVSGRLSILTGTVNGWVLYFSVRLVVSIEILWL